MCVCVVFFIFFKSPLNIFLVLLFWAWKMLSKPNCYDCWTWCNHMKMYNIFDKSKNQDSWEREEQNKEYESPPKERQSFERYKTNQPHTTPIKIKNKKKNKTALQSTTPDNHGKKNTHNKNTRAKNQCKSLPTTQIIEILN